MRPPACCPHARAARLLRLYPRSWRRRYGDEFTQLLVDDITERPRSPARTLDVVRGGILARLSAAGLCGNALAGDSQARAGLAWSAAALGAFFTGGIALWSQLAVDWQWSAPAAPGTRSAMVLMTAAAAALLGLAALALMPLLWIARRPPRVAALLVAAGLAALVAGSLHFGRGWPGTGGHPWPGRGLVPPAAARVCWAATLWITSYWGHPGALARFPGAEILWMACAPVAMLAIVTGGVRALRGEAIPQGVLRYETWLAAAAACAMAVFVAGALSWIAAGDGGPRGLFHPGAIDAGAVAGLAAACLVAARASRRALGAARG